jgi:hypothetical protein
MVKALAANSAWLAASAAPWAAFTRALCDPAREQQKLLHRYLRGNGPTAFGREHGFCEINSYEQFAQRVPIRDYDQLATWIDRIRRGQQRVLTSAPVRRLVPTGGSTAARKLIPYTDESHREFQRAVGPWVFDLYRRVPRVIGGPSYWSITPQTKHDFSEANCKVPIGFAGDSEYLGGIVSRIIGGAMAAPNQIAKLESFAEVRRATAAALLQQRELRLISVWHPSFLELLFADVKFDLRRCWPKLKVISCWADGHARGAAAALSQKFPGVTIQPKGLLATEGVVSIPFKGEHPLAIRSHFFEFIDTAGNVALAADLRVGQTYNVVLTTAGGLWRYRLDDLIEVTGFCGRTPSIRFLGKAGLISDRMGEKLSEGFVAGVLSKLFAARSMQPRFALLAPDLDGAFNHYTLFADELPPSDVAGMLDELLAENPQYQYCRRLGQLRAPRLFRVTGDAYSCYCARLVSAGQRLGDIKPAALSKLDDWSSCFAGAYAA